MVLLQRHRPLAGPDHRPGLFPADRRDRALAVSRRPQARRSPARGLGVRGLPPSPEIRQRGATVRLRVRPALAETIMPIPTDAKIINKGYSARGIPPTAKKRGAITMDNAAAI